MRVYKCDICGSEKIAEYVLGADLESCHYGPPIGWKHIGWRNGTTICASCRSAIKKIKKDTISE